MPTRRPSRAPSRAQPDVVPLMAAMAAVGIDVESWGDGCVGVAPGGVHVRWDGGSHATVTGRKGPVQVPVDANATRTAAAILDAATAQR